MTDVVTTERHQRRFGALLIAFGLVGFVGSLALTLERIWSLIDPSHVPSCSFNVFMTCGPAMESWQGSLLGFPNPVIGVAAFPVVVTIGVLLALAPSLRLPRWFWWVFLAGNVLGLALVVFLIHTSLYELAALCPYCMVVWTAMVPLAWYTFVHVWRTGVLGRGSEKSGLVRYRHLGLGVVVLVLLTWILLVLGDDIARTLG